MKNSNSSAEQDFFHLKTYITLSQYLSVSLIHCTLLIVSVCLV